MIGDKDLESEGTPRPRIAPRQKRRVPWLPRSTVNDEQPGSCGAPSTLLRHLRQTFPDEHPRNALASLVNVLSGQKGAPTSVEQDSTGEDAAAEEREEKDGRYFGCVGGDIGSCAGNAGPADNDPPVDRRVPRGEGKRGLSRVGVATRDSRQGCGNRRGG